MSTWLYIAAAFSLSIAPDWRYCCAGERSSRARGQGGCAREMALPDITNKNRGRHAQDSSFPSFRHFAFALFALPAIAAPEKKIQCRDVAVVHSRGDGHAQRDVPQRDAERQFVDQLVEARGACGPRDREHGRGSAHGELAGNDHVQRGIDLHLEHVAAEAARYVRTDAEGERRRQATAAPLHVECAGVDRIEFRGRHVPPVVPARNDRQSDDDRHGSGYVLQFVSQPQNAVKGAVIPGSAGPVQVQLSTRPVASRRRSTAT